MRYKDVVKFKEDFFFNGSVEIDCIYNDRKLANKAASSYVFHNKNSFTKSENGNIDSITFTKKLFDIIYGENQNNPFITTIAGYGAGKSHFCTAIAALFVNNEKFLSSKRTLDNIRDLDSEFAERITNYLDKPNIIFALNGMNDFNLTSIMNKQLKEYLKTFNLNIQLFTETDKIYNNTKKFIDSFFNTEQFQIELKEQLQKDQFSEIDSSIDFLKNNIFNDNVFLLINSISEKLTGNKYIIENYLNPRTILDEISKKLCGEGKPFGKVLIIFDEIGRYIEWLGTNRTNDPSIMQQLYEGVKNSSGKATFLSFIQFPLATYFSHLSPGVYASISRYIDRYKTARNFYLSTVLETVFANLVEINNNKVFNDYSMLQPKLLSWQPDLQKSMLWFDKDYYKKLICEKLSAFHPLTISLLARLAEFTQKRGPMMILRELLEKYSNYEITAVPAIYPVSIFNTEFKSDILKMENDGLLKTDNVSIYDQLISKPKYNRNLSSEDKAFLQAILIINLLSLKPVSYSDYLELLVHLTGSKNNKIEKIIQKLGEELGVIQYDDDLFFHHIEIDAIGKKDFERFLVGKKNEIIIENNYSDPYFFTEKLKEIYKNELVSFKTVFYKNITTLEWEFTQEIIDSRCNIEEEIKYYIEKSEKAILPKLSKGTMLWIYINCDISQDVEKEMQDIESIITKCDLEQYPIQIGFLLDTNSELYASVLEFDTIHSLNSSEREKYAAFVETKINSVKSVNKNCYLRLRKEAYFYIDKKITKSNDLFNKITNEKIKKLYSNIIPFKFDGFSKENNHNARREYTQIIKAFSAKSVSLIDFENFLQANQYNRMLGLLGGTSWNIFNDGKISKPKNEKVRIIYDILDKEFHNVSEDETLKLDIIFKKLLTTPYGMNIYSANLLLIYILYSYKDRFTFNYADVLIEYKDWINIIIDDNKVNHLLIRETTIIYSDPEKIKNSIISDLNNILESNSISDVLKFSKRVTEYSEKNDSDQEISQKLAQVENKIFSAKKVEELYKIFFAKCESVVRLFNDIDDVVPDILKEYLNINNDWEELLNEVERSTMKLPREWEDMFDNISIKTGKFIQENFELWFKDNSWPKNNNIEGFTTFNKKLVKSLHYLGFKSYPRMINDAIKKVNDSYEYLSKCQTRIADYQNRVIPSTHSECNEYKNSINEFIKEISLSLLFNKNQKNNYIGQLTDVKEKLEKKIYELDKKLENAYNILSDKEFTELKEIESYIHQLKSILNTINVNHPDYSIINDTLNNAQEVLDTVNKLKEGDFLENEIKSRVNELKIQFKDNIEDDPDYIFCPKIFDNIESYLFQMLTKKIEEWMSFLPKGDLNKLNNAKLHQVLIYISNPPKYLQDKELVFLEEIDSKINKIINDSTTDHIYKLFDSIEEVNVKIEVIKKLNSSINNIKNV